MPAGVAAARLAAAALLVAAGLAGGGSSRAEAVERLVARLLLYAAVPVITFYKVATVSLGLVASYALVSAASMLGALATAAAAAPRMLRGLPRETVAAAVIAAGVHNAGFLPIPLMLLLYGDPGPAALYSAMANIYMGFAYPLVLSALLGRGGGLRGVARSLAGFPPLYGVAGGLAASILGLQPPAVAEQLYHAATDATLLSFYLVGSTLRRSGVGLDRAVAFVAAWRLLVEPGIAFNAARLAGLRGLWLAGALLESFMPPATMNLVVAMAYGLDYRVVARSIGLVTPVSIALAALLRLHGPAE